MASIVFISWKWEKYSEEDDIFDLSIGYLLVEWFLTFPFLLLPNFMSY